MAKIIDPLIKKALNGTPLKEYRGFCGEAADLILKVAGKGDILYVEPFPPHGLATASNVEANWKYHMVALVDKKIYDPWSPYAPCGIKEYVIKTFMDQGVVLALNGIDFYKGRADEYKDGYYILNR